MHNICKKWSRTCLIKEVFLEIPKLLLASKAKGERVGKELTSWMRSSCTSTYSRFPFQQPSSFYSVIPSAEHMDGWRRARPYLTEFSWQIQFSFLWDHYSKVLRVLPLKGLHFYLTDFRSLCLEDPKSYNCLWNGFGQTKQGIHEECPPWAVWS